MASVMPEPPPSPLERAREDLTYRITGLRIVLAAFVVGTFAAALVASWLTHSDTVTELVVVACLVGVAATSLRLNLTRCPRCGDRFFVKRHRYVNTFVSSCVNCGLALLEWPDGPPPRFRS